MKKIILSLALLALTANFANAEEDNSELQDAPVDTVMEFLSYCTENAAEDSVVEVEMNKYLLVCINEELTDSYFNTISVVPTQE
ncbi:hypothetical protein [Colwellia echini]|uniref:Uncharacterized protein n=1 Tax=Colwellia echini TaxID=1982103 RepID=A0ABY3MTH7_9GAMM|nr:hypothetical protein [Colwellia echini]TYK64505.1 hypothetical protein CWS31_015150 [Colwellia echini]